MNESIYRKHVRINGDRSSTLRLNGDSLQDIMEVDILERQGIYG